MDIPTAEQLAEYSLAQQHPTTVAWTPRDRRLRLLAIEHEVDVRMMTDLDVAAMRRGRFGPELPIEFFLNAWHPISDDLSAMLSVRWEGGDPTRPFVDASALSREVTDADLRPLCRAAGDRYAAIKPRYLRWWSRQPVGRYPGTQQDKRFLAAPIRDLLAAQAPTSLTLSLADELNHYQTARDAYAAVDHEHPAHTDQAAIESKDDLEELRQDGTLFDVRLDGRWCGYVAAERGHKLGLDGYKIAELVLSRAARGRGLGRHLSGLLAEALAARGAPEGSVIIGTIHHDNLGARRAAEGSGRRDVGGWVRRPLG